ncbi:MAG: NfeD family protein [Oscillospiraceae bacterium]|nr:NfeD family protein [Oscillospiraceae bacterium]
MDVMIFVWLGALIVFGAFEAISVGLTSIWFALGSFAALIAALLKGPLWLQIVLFVVVSAVTLIFTRPLAKKYINSRRVATNADRVFTITGVVREDIDNLQAKGVVAVDGKDWSARSLTGEPIPAGTKVRTKKIDGVKLIVVPADACGDGEEPS